MSGSSPNRPVYRAVRFVRQEFGGERSLAGPIRPGDDKDSLVRGHVFPGCSGSVTTLSSLYCVSCRQAPTTARSESQIPITIAPLLVLAMLTKTSVSLGAGRRLDRG